MAVPHFTPPHLHYQVTTRGRAPDERSGPRIFWNPYQELVQLGRNIGGRHSGRFEIAYDDFLAAAQSQSTPRVTNPWHVGFPTAGWDRHPPPLGIIDPWAAGTR